MRLRSKNTSRDWKERKGGHPERSACVWKGSARYGRNRDLTVRTVKAPYKARRGA